MVRILIRPLVGSTGLRYTVLCALADKIVMKQFCFFYSSHLNTINIFYKLFIKELEFT